MTIKSKRIFLRKFPLLIIAVGNPIVLYNLKICSPSKESSRNSVGGALYREHGPSEDGNPALFFFPFYTTLQSSLNYIVAHSSFHFVTLPKVFFLASLPFQNTLLSWGHVRTPLVNTIFKFSFHAWQVQGVEYCTANAVRVRIEILYRGTCRFVLFFSSFSLWFLFQFIFSKLRCYSYFIPA